MAPGGNGSLGGDMVLGNDVLVGNDVVDLSDPEARLEGLHPRFTQRAFCTAERAALAVCSSRHVLHWALWAAKESAYKALKRTEPGLAFSPRELEVDCPALAALARSPAGLRRATGRVLHRGRALGLNVQWDRDSVHAIAWSADAAAGPLLADLGQADGDPSAAVRRLATKALGARLAVRPEALRVEGRPPVVWQGDRPVDAVVSLSHHGRFVAYACALRG